MSRSRSHRQLLPLALSLFAALLLANCAPPALQPTATRRVPTATSTATPLPTITPEQFLPAATALPQTPAPSSCTEVEGRVLEVTIPTERLNTPIQTRVYLPPCYQAEAQQAYPVLLMLHGQGFQNDQWVRLGLTAEADRMIVSREILPLIIVMPYELSWSEGPEGSKFGEALVMDVLPYIEETYNACSDRACRAVGGLSRGGNWAVNLGFSYPAVFSAVGAHSAPLFFGEVTRINTVLSRLTSVTELPAFFIDVGQHDPNREDVLIFLDLLDKAGVDYQFYQFLGTHDEEYWSSHVREYLNWYSARLSTDQAESQPTPGN